MDAAERAVGAQTRGIQFKHQLSYHQHQIDYATEALQEASATLAEMRDELPDQAEDKLKPGEATKVRAHLRKVKKKAVENEQEKTPRHLDAQSGQAQEPEVPLTADEATRFAFNSSRRTGQGTP